MIGLFTAMLVSILSSALVITADETTASSPPCNFPAIYNFGDSNSDTGAMSSAFFPPVPPNGNTYFHGPAGRPCDGRLIIDFVADQLGLPFLSPYLDSVGSNFSHGANFATNGATVLRLDESWFKRGASPFPIEIQVQQFTQFKDRTYSYYNQSEGECFIKRLPKPEEFSKSLFTIDIGQNDVALRILNNEFDPTGITPVIDQIVSQVRILYQKGARSFWVHNTGPIGCLPLNIVKVKDPSPGFFDEIGCIKKQNDLALEFNKQLKDGIAKLRNDLQGSAIVYVDIYGAKYELISQAKKLGFEDPFKICCGYSGIDYDVKCGTKGMVNGTEVFAGSCADPLKVISWDGVHYSEAANHWVANRIADGSLSDPPLSLKNACQKQMPSL